MSAADLQGFAREFIYGTGVPQVYYDYDIERGPSGTWIVRGSASRLRAPRWDLHLTRRGTRSWDLRRSYRLDPHEVAAPLMVPFHLAVKETTSTEEGPESARGEGRGIRAGMVLLKEARDHFEVSCDVEPLELTMDPQAEILAYFHSAKKDPRRVARYTALNLIAEGRLQEAEASYLRALDAPTLTVEPPGPIPWIHTPETQERRERVRIHLSLARLYLGQERFRAAQSRLNLVDEILGPEGLAFRVEREVLRARLEVMRSEPESAFRRLRRALRVATRRRSHRSAEPVGVRLGSEWQAVAEAYALLAVAAYETERFDEALWATREAREHGVDMDELSSLFQGSPSAR
jgi:hypothetical protein